VIWLVFVLVLLLLVIALLLVLVVEGLEDNAPARRAGRQVQDARNEVDVAFMAAKAMMETAAGRGERRGPDSLGNWKEWS